MKTDPYWIHGYKFKNNIKAEIENTEINELLESKEVEKDEAPESKNVEKDEVCPIREIDYDQEIFGYGNLYKRMVSFHSFFFHSSLTSRKC